jgi:hypothetical protein
MDVKISSARPTSLFKVEICIQGSRDSHENIILPLHVHRGSYFCCHLNLEGYSLQLLQFQLQIEWHLVLPFAVCLTYLRGEIWEMMGRTTFH